MKIHKSISRGTVVPRVKYEKKNREKTQDNYNHTVNNAFVHHV